MSLSRKNYIKRALLRILQSLLEKETKKKSEEKKKYMKEKCPPLSLPQTVTDLQDLCRTLHKRIDLVDEDLYDAELRALKSEREEEELKEVLQKLQLKRPVLRRVRLSADAMLSALLGPRHTVCLDLRGALKEVKKEVKEEENLAADWRKIIEDKAGMDGRKRMFETEVEDRDRGPRPRTED